MQFVCCCPTECSSLRIVSICFHFLCGECDSVCCCWLQIRNLKLSASLTEKKKLKSSTWNIQYLDQFVLLLQVIPLVKRERERKKTRNWFLLACCDRVSALRTHVFTIEMVVYSYISTPHASAIVWGCRGSIAAALCRHRRPATCFICLFYTP